MAASRVINLGAGGGLHFPDYAIAAYRDGDPRKAIPASKLDLRSVTAIQTSKSLSDVSGTFNVTLKDGRAQHQLREMDVLTIAMRGHADGRMTTVLRPAVVDTVGHHGDAAPNASQEDVAVSGRCGGKYLQTTSLFLPVWDPQGALPTATTFGLGDPTNKAGGATPYDIFRYLVHNYTFGSRKLAGLSGIPNSRFWLDAASRFSRSVGFQVPFLQFDEDSIADALQRLEILGFTEAWLDELGRVVYRHPRWDAPVSYRLHTDHVISDTLERSDVDAATYVEVVPAGAAGIDPGVMQALAAGRAPVPSSYLSANGGEQLLQHVDHDYVIETDRKGVPTAAGRRNHWYRLQRRLGLRPLQIESPLIATQAQAQKQAEGLLRFYTRMTKGGTVTIPGEPRIRLGTTIQLHGTLRGKTINRVYYVEGVQHDFQWGSEYTTTLTLTHGRDPWDPKWGEIALPSFDASQLAGGSGVLGQPGASSGGDPSRAAAPGSPDVPGHPELQTGISRVVNTILSHWPKLEITSTTNHGVTTSNGNRSLHVDGRAADLANADYAYMARAGEWIAANMTSMLTEGIHNATGGGEPASGNLSVKNGQTVPPSFWDNGGAQTWEEHVNHIHVGV